MLVSRCICLSGYIGHDKLGRIYHTYLATIIQLFMMNIKQICCKNILIKLHRVFFTFKRVFTESRLETRHFLQLLFIEYILVI